jgi:CRP-like cAMP-binding protein
MLTTIEKVIFLQNIDAFEQVPTEQLAEVAAIAEEMSILEGDVIYRENDASDALYLVLEGKIRMHRGDDEFAVVGDKEAFGTWALFDATPRVVTATAISDAHLLRVEREEFVDLLADHVQIAQGMLKTVAGRLRRLAERAS